MAPESRFNEDTASEAATGGHLEILKILKIHNCRDMYLAATYAALSGHRNLLEWFRNEGIDLDANVCASAAEGGHFEILKWLREIGCEWNPEVTMSAARHNHFEILKWAYENGCEIDSMVCANAAVSGNLEMIKWLKEKGCPIWSNFFLSHAAGKGHTHVMDWALENGYPIDDRIVQRAGKEAVYQGSIEGLNWLVTHGFTLHLRLSDFFSTNLEVLKWAANYYGDRFFDSENVRDLMDTRNTRVCWFFFSEYFFEIFGVFLTPKKGNHVDGRQNGMSTCKKNRSRVGLSWRD